MEDVQVLRRRIAAGELSVRKAARLLGHSRNTVKRYLAGATPGERKASSRERPVSGALGAAIAALLDEEKRNAHGKHRLTAARIHDLLHQQGLPGSYSTVKEIVRELRRRDREVYVPLVYAPAEVAQCDFFEVWTEQAGLVRRGRMFQMRLMYSGVDFSWIFEHEDLPSFLEGHRRAFEFFGGVMQRCAYDNLKLAVESIQHGNRRLNERFEKLTVHYNFEATFARPREGHDKGGIESAGRSVRRNLLTPMLKGANLHEVNAQLLARLEQRRDTNEKFSAERELLRSLPKQEFETRTLQTVRISQSATTRIKNVSYSVPSRWAGLRIDALIGGSEMEFRGPDGVVTHQRGRPGESCIDYRHYLRELARKPQALRQVAAVLAGQMGEPFVRVWNELQQRYPGLDGARRFSRILTAIEEHGLDTIRREIACSQDGAASGALLLCAAREPKSESCVHHPAFAAIQVEAANAAQFDLLIEAGQ